MMRKNSFTLLCLHHHPFIIRIGLRRKFQSPLYQQVFSIGTPCWLTRSFLFVATIPYSFYTTDILWISTTLRTDCWSLSIDSRRVCLAIIQVFTEKRRNNSYLAIKGVTSLASRPTHCVYLRVSSAKIHLNLLFNIHHRPVSSTVRLMSTTLVLSTTPVSDNTPSTK